MRLASVSGVGSTCVLAARGGVLLGERRGTVHLRCPRLVVIPTRVQRGPRSCAVRDLRRLFGFQRLCELAAASRHGAPPVPVDFPGRQRFTAWPLARCVIPTLPPNSNPIR